jgi:acetyl/propionyl-CoA carboxylase alpha subunit
MVLGRHRPGYTWIISGTTVSPFYDSMVAEVMVRDNTSRNNVLDKIALVLAKSLVRDCSTNLIGSEVIIEAPDFQS